MALGLLYSIQSAPADRDVNASQNVLLSEHGFLLRSRRWKQPRGRQQRQRTALAAKPTEIETGTRTSGGGGNRGNSWEFVGNAEKAVFRASCLVKTVGRGLGLLYRETPAGRLTFFVAYVCATDLGITGHEKRLFSPDAKHTGAEKARLKGFSTNRHQTSHGKSRVSKKSRDS